LRIYLAVTPDNLREASRWTKQLAHAAYRIGPDGHLTRQDPLRAQGGLMLLSDEGCGPIPDGRALCREIFRECCTRGFSGVVADFTHPPSTDRDAFLRFLAALLQKNRMLLFTPETYACQNSSILICTAISGGSFRRRLEEAVGRYGAARVALDLQRLRMRFPLPCPGGEGIPLSAEELSVLQKELRPAVFYSADLCARYFTYSRDHKRYFVLFDDADTLLRKIRTAQELGIPNGFFMYPEVSDLLPELFPPRQNVSPTKNNR